MSLKGNALNQLIRSVENGNFDNLEENLDNRGSSDINLGERGQGKQTDAANFTLIIRRVVVTALGAAFNLPFAMFGSSAAINGYRRLLAPVIPAGVTLVFVQRGEYNNAPESVRFFYTDGVGGSEYIDVSCPQTPYPQLLEAAYTDNFKASKLRYKITDATAQAQFAQSLTIWRTSMFGRNTFDTLDLSTYEKPNDFKTTIVDIEGTLNIDKEMCLTHFIVPNPNPAVQFGVNLSMFVEKYYRQTAQGL